MILVLTGMFYLLSHPYSCINKKRSAHNYDRDFDYCIFGHWSIRICLNLGDFDSFKKTPEQSQKRETWPFGIQAYSRAEYKTKQIPVIANPAFVLEAYINRSGVNRFN